jgi:ribosomal protein S18 acetylase RimI-like enzyme
MIGEAAGLSVDVPLPPAVVVRRAGDGGALRADVARAVAMQGAVFGNDSGPSAEFLTATIEADPRRIELWVAEVDGVVVSAGRIDVVPGTEFAGIWGGATLPEWRGRGIYRALTAARARSALAQGVRYIHSDSTEMSRPILERSGLQAVTTTTPYVWTRSS